MATYKYQQNVYEGSSEGYVQYNITPDFGTVLAVGETFEITGKMYAGYLKRYGVVVEAGIELNGYGLLVTSRELGRVEQECAKGRSVTFSVTCEVTQALANLTDDRAFRPYLKFVLADAEDLYSGAGTVSVEGQQLSALGYRLAPVVNAVTVNDTTEAFGYFGGAVEGKSNLSFDVDVTLDPLDDSLSIQSAIFVAGTNRRNIDSSKINGNVITLGALDFNGTFENWTLVVNDSKGEVGSYAGGALTVFPYEPPKLITPTDTDLAERYSTSLDDGGGEVVSLDDAGIYLWANFSATIAEINGKNAWTITRSYAERGYKLGDEAVVMSSTDGGSFGAVQDQNIWPRSIEFAANKRYTVRLVLKDYFEEVVLQFDVDKAGGYFNIEKNGVAVGMRTTATEQEKKFESAYPFYPYAGIKRCDNAVYEVPLTLDGAGKFQLYSDTSPLKLMVYGNIVHLIGEVTPTAAIAGSTTEYAITTLPPAYAPKHPVTALCQASSAAIWMLRAYPSDHEAYPGFVIFSRHRNGSSYASCAAGNWLPFFASWMVGGTTVEDDSGDAEDTEVRIVRPAAAMSGYSSQNCVVSASSEYNQTTYAAWRAFNKTYGDQYGWATARGTLEGWIQLQMDVALKKISVTIINRTYTYNDGPEAGVIYGSEDGVEWTSIGTFNGRDGATNGLKTVHECNNDEIAYRYVRINVSRTSDVLVSIGEIIIEGVEVQ